MSDESTKKVTKKHRKSEQKEKGSKVKKRRKSGPGTAEDGHGLCEGHQRFNPSITKSESMKDPTLPRRAEEQLSNSGTPPDTPPNTLSKAKVSGKRKRTDRDAAMRDESVNSEADASESEPQRNKKRDEDREDRMHRLPYPDPAVDESLSEQSRRALSYAYERCRGSEAWKFNKGRQNWLLRNVWSERAVPENHIPLVIKYLVGIRGGAREKLVGECISKMSTSEEAPIQGAQSFDDSVKVRPMINQQPNTSRALSILHALKKSS